MNNISQISKAKRLTEEEVHAAAEELSASGSRASSLEVYKHLGRGSLTTITNFLKTWHPEDQQTTALPALMSLPESLSKTAEQLIIKIWSESQVLAEKEINSQREALRQVESMAKEKISEAEAFSEEQAKIIENLETTIFDQQNEARLNFTELESKLIKAMEKINELEKENKVLIEKTARIEGELKAWKEFKPEKIKESGQEKIAPKTKAITKSQKLPGQAKQTSPQSEASQNL